MDPLRPPRLQDAFTVFRAQRAGQATLTAPYQHWTVQVNVVVR